MSRPKVINVKCPVCGERSETHAVTVGLIRKCHNCQQTVQLIPEPSHIRTLKYCVKLAGALLLLWFAWSVLAPKI